MKIKFIKSLCVSTLIACGLIACGGGGGGSSTSTSSGATTGQFQTPPSAAVAVTPTN